MGGWGRVIVAGFVAGSSLGARAQEGGPVSACRFDLVGGGQVAQVIDGSSFTLGDGREVRLAAIEGLAPKGVLEAVLAGATVALRQHGAVTDRYGRTVAFAYFTRDGIERSAAHDLLAQGQARVTANVGNVTCAAELLARERVARTAGVGLWSDPDHAMVGAGDFARLMGELGRFAVVEGKVLSVRESGGTTYVNFGRRWSQALTVTILKRHERIFAGAGLPPKMLENRRVRVRGWVEERNGPRIEATRPEQIELVELLN